MESVAHGIGVKNRYALFYDEDVDPLEILRQQEEDKSKRKTDKTAVKDKGKVTKSNKPAVTNTSPKKPIENVSAKNKGQDNIESANKTRGKPPTDRFQRNFGNNQDSKDFEDRKNNRNKDDQFFSSEHKDRDTEYRRGRGGPRGGRGGRGDRGGRGFYGNAENRPRRMFDRHSGSDKTGVRPTEKRDGAGPNNWGDIRGNISQGKDDMWEEADTTTEKARESWADDDTTTEKKEVVTSSDLDNTDTKENEPLPEESAEEAVKQMTLDEWKREQEAKRAVPKYNLRKPGEGEDDKMWKKGYVLKKKAKEEDEDQEEEEDDDEEYNRKHGHRQLLDIQINFSDSRRGTRGRGRGGRGAPRPGPRDAGPREERGGMRGGRGGGGGGSKVKGPQSAPRVDDFNDFPSLVNA